MEIQEAVQHCREVAARTKRGKCPECAADHGQLAEWLTVLKQIAEIFNCDPGDPAQLKQLCDKLRGWQAADQDGRMRITDVEGKCGSCLHYRRRGDFPACGSCLKKPYGHDVVHDPKYPYAMMQRTQPKCKQYKAKAAAEAAKTTKET